MEHDGSLSQQDGSMSALNFTGDWANDGESGNFDLPPNEFPQTDFLADVVFNHDSSFTGFDNPDFNSIISDFHGQSENDTDQAGIQPVSSGLPVNQYQSAFGLNPQEGTDDAQAVPSDTLLHQISSEPPTTRRRDYTKEEKSLFEDWITTNPNPKRAQRLQFASRHGLTKAQVDNLINNRKRNKRRVEAFREQNTAQNIAPTAISEDILISSNNYDHRKSNENLDRTLHTITTIGANNGSSLNDQQVTSSRALKDKPLPALPVSEENLRRSLEGQPSYSSVREYLQSEEKSVPFDSNPRNLRIFAGRRTSIVLSQVQNKKMTAEDMCSWGWPICCLCAVNMALDEEVFQAPCLRLFHQNCLETYLKLCTALDECPVCGQNLIGRASQRCPNRSGVDNKDENKHPPVTFFRHDSTVSITEASESSSAASGTSSVYSFTSSTSRRRAKRLRRRERLILLEQCSFCGKGFNHRSHMLAHEIERHCLPQTFPCTYCLRRFPTPLAWRDHEFAEHFKSQSAWFCMLGDTPADKCIFCEDILPDTHHLKRAHLLEPCDCPLSARTFATRHSLINHLLETHGMSEQEVAAVSVNLQSWELRLNIKDERNYGLWGCGYCGQTGADWDGRVNHIMDHWMMGGPRFTQMHRWKDHKTKLGAEAVTHITSLMSGEGVKDSRNKGLPSKLKFHDYNKFEAVLLARVSSQPPTLAWKLFTWFKRKKAVNEPSQSEFPSESAHESAASSSSCLSSEESIQQAQGSSFFDLLKQRKHSWLAFTAEKRKQRTVKKGV